MTQSVMTKYDFSDVIRLYNDTLTPLAESYKNSKNMGGKVRGTVGKLYENIAHAICLMVNPNLTILHNDYINVPSRSGVYFKKTQVDLHVYLNDKLILVIEGKTYLDSSMLDRAISEFNKIRRVKDKMLPCAVFTGQECINEETFMWFHEEEPFDAFVVNSTTKRDGKYPIFQTLDPLNINKLTQFADYVDNIVQRSC